MDLNNWNANKKPINFLNIAFTLFRLSIAKNPGPEDPVFQD